MADAVPDELSPYQRRRDYTLWLVLGFVLASVVIHLIAFSGMSAYAQLQKKHRPLNKPIEMVMVEVVRPPPPPPPEEPKVEEPPPPPKPKPKPPPIKVAEAPKPVEPPPEDIPPPPNETPPADTPPQKAPLVVGISMSSTSASGGFAAPVGNTLYGKTDKTAKNPTEVKAYSAPKYMPSYQVDRQPEVLAEVKAPYPNEARRAGIEGSVIVSLKIDENGKVIGVKAISGPGYGLEEAAVTALWKYRFRPATKGGEAVGTEIKFTYTFYLD